MDPWWTIAAATSLLTAGIHTFVGEREIARPLLAAEGLRRVPKFTAFYCWHMVTIVLFAMSAGFVWAARVPAAHEIGLVCTGLAGSFALWSLALVAWSRMPMLALPQWALFLPIFAAGVLGGQG